MMIHVWDHFDYTHDVSWWKAQGWPLLKVIVLSASWSLNHQSDGIHTKGIAQFQLSKLIPDEHFNDTTLVVAPCNSPEQAPITFGMSAMLWLHRVDN